MKLAALTVTPLCALAVLGCTTAPAASNAITSVECGMNGQLTTSCPISVRSDPSGVDNWFVTITRPNGLPRAIYFSENEPWGGDGAEADGSAGFEFSYSRQGLASYVSFGPERYLIPDAAIPGY